MDTGTIIPAFEAISASEREIHYCAGHIESTGGTVTANGGRYGAGIGGGDGGNGGSITITGGTIKATGDTGIGDGVYGSGGTLKITGGSINASTNLQPTNGSANVYPNTLTLPDAVNASVTAGAINENSCAETPVPASGVYGIKDVATDESGKLYLYLPNSDENSIELTANGTLYKGTTGSTSTLKPPYAITLDKNRYAYIFCCLRLQCPIGTRNGNECRFSGNRQFDR